jgi:predicted dehydrogenase
MRSVCVVGAGRLGIRHVEGLLSLTTPLTIRVVDPSEDAQNHVRELAKRPSPHVVSSGADLPSSENIDCAIIATTARERADLIRALLSRATVRTMLLEKVLFTRVSDYADIGTLLAKQGVTAWVNCPLRLMPVRREMRELLGGGPFSIHLNGGKEHGLMTNIIHYADYASYLARSSDFRVDASLLAHTTTLSKRSGYRELLGSLALHFSNGSKALCTSLAHARPRRTVLSGTHIRALFEEAAGTALLSEEKDDWKWREVPASFSLQSEMTGPLVRTMMEQGTCELPTYEESSALHLKIIHGVREAITRILPDAEDDFPFT